MSLAPLLFTLILYHVKRKKSIVFFKKNKKMKIIKNFKKRLLTIFKKSYTMITKGGKTTKL